VEARLLTIALLARMQRQGVGGRLMQEIEMRMRRSGALELTLEVREDNVKGIAFYRRKGYDISGRMPRYYQDGTQAILMRKAL
jgi:[ribosomal protein S18]-alanine N-acetyltransferase